MSVGVASFGVGNVLELAIIAFIVVSIGYLMWRGGAANPVGTGGIDRRLRAVSRKADEIERRVETIEREGASVADVARLEAQMAAHATEMKLMSDRVAALPGQIEANRAAIERMAAALPDIASRQRALADLLAGVREEGAARTKSIEHLSKQVDRLYDVLVPRGLKK